MNRENIISSSEIKTNYRMCDLTSFLQEKIVPSCTCMFMRFYLEIQF